MSNPGRLDRVRACLSEEQLDALLIGVPVDDPFGRHAANRFWLTGFTGTAGTALVTRDRALLAADFRYIEQAEHEVTANGFTVFPALGGLKQWWPLLIGDAGLARARIGISRADISYGEFVALQESTAELPPHDRPELVAAPPLIERLRAHKDGAELEHLERAIEIADNAFEMLLEDLTPDWTERQVATRFAANVQSLGAQGPSFATIVAAGAHAAMPHAQPTDDRLGEDRPVVIDMGALFQGYCSDLTRTIVLGRPDRTFDDLYRIVFEAQRRAIEGVEPGMTGATAHRLASDVIDSYGHAEHFGHGLGHGVGLEVHEHPYLGLTSQDVLEEGMVFTIEPGIYLPGWGGIRIEDTVILERGRARVLSHARKRTPQESD